MKMMYVDIGELGWSLYLSAHIRWLKQRTDNHIGVMTYIDRYCLYRNVADIIYKVPDDFCVKFNRNEASFFGIAGISNEELKGYFVKKIPTGYKFVGYFGCYKKIKTEFKPYSYNKKLNRTKEILILPRCRNTGYCHNLRNLPKKFYIEAINALCIKFPDYTIRAMGIPSGAYNISEIKKTNYVNDVREGADLQDLINRCQVIMVAIGSQSGPLKITLLQGVPTFIIGHQRKRHMKIDNWMSTKAEFYGVSRNKYSSINSEDCINKIIAFVERCQ